MSGTESGLQGYLVVKVLEAAGQNGDDDQVWDETVRDVFVKIEIRGQQNRPVKKQTSVSRVSGGTVSWDEQLALEHYGGSGELRILLCQPKPKKEGEKASSVVLAACGIYMKDILEAVPIDKYFELFKPQEGADGGFIRISMNYLKPDQYRASNIHSLKKKTSRGGLIPKLFMGAILIAGGAYAAKMIQESKDKANDGNTKQKKGALSFGNSANNGTSKNSNKK